MGDNEVIKAIEAVQNYCFGRKCEECILWKNEFCSTFFHEAPAYWMTEEMLHEEE